MTGQRIVGRGRAVRSAPTGRQRGRRARFAVLVVAWLAGGLLSCGSPNAVAPSTGAAPVPSTSAGPVSPTGSLNSVAPAVSPAPAVGTPVAVAEALPESTPVRVTLPKINADSSLVPLGLDPDGTLSVPPVSKPLQAGWYTGGPTPGEVGPAVIVGHVDGLKKPGIFYRLREVAAGDVVLVARADGSTAKFVVSEKQQVAKSRFPTERVYGDTEGPELRLITCGGAFDRPSRNYLDNVIVYAKLAP